jgi:hypothetical protein
MTCGTSLLACGMSQAVKSMARSFTKPRTEGDIPTERNKFIGQSDVKETSKNL